jgi:hypothetical protein
MNLEDLIEQLDQRYGNPHSKEHLLVKEAIKVLRQVQESNKEFTVEDLQNGNYKLS